MRGEELLERFGNIDATYIEAAEKLPHKKMRSWPKAAAVAVCLCAVVAIGAAIAVPDQMEGNLEHKQMWSEDFQAEDYFHNNQHLEAETSVSAESSMCYAEDSRLYSDIRSFSDDRRALEQAGMIPEMAEHRAFYCEGMYNDDDSLYGVRIEWQKRGETAEDYSDLTILAGPQVVELPVDRQHYARDEAGNVIEQHATVTVRDGVEIVAEGWKKDDKTLTFKKDGVWYQVSGSFADDFEDVVALLDWVWEHPIDLTYFAIERGDTLTQVALESMPDAFAGVLPDFAAYGFSLEQEVVPLTLKNDEPYSFYGEYYNVDRSIFVTWSVETKPNPYALNETLGDFTMLDKQTVAAALEGQGYVPFTMDGCLITVQGTDAEAVWTLIASLKA